MSTYSPRDEDLQKREQELHEREMQLRLRELEAELADHKKKVAAEESGATVAHDQDQEALARQRKNRKLILFAKFGALGLGVALTVVVLNVLLFPMIVGGVLIALLYGAYVLFIRESPKTTK